MEDIKLDYYLCLKTLDLVKIYIPKIAKKNQLPFTTQQSGQHSWAHSQFLVHKASTMRWEENLKFIQLLISFNFFLCLATLEHNLSSSEYSGYLKKTRPRNHCSSLFSSGTSSPQSHNFTILSLGFIFFFFFFAFLSFFFSLFFSFLLAL